VSNVVVVGAQWGDEGKAKITDLLAEEADVVVRCQGGCNAGHTVQHQGEVFKFHLIPSGLLYPHKLCMVGPGTVIDPSVLLREIEEMQQKGYSTDNLKVSTRAHLTLPDHIAQDKAQENALAQKKIGTTGRGIGPTYMDKVGRLGVRMGDLYDPPELLRERLTHIAQTKAPLLEHCVDPTPKQVEARVESWFQFCQDFAARLKPYVTDTVSLLHEEVAKERNILFEGAQGTLLDVDYGTYPFVTSSNATAGGACTGSGLGPTHIDRVIGVMKAYTTRVGEGPFPTELKDEIGQHLVDVGQEYGTTTGRLRRCGWFDAVIGKYSVQVNGLDGLALTKLDVLDDLKEIKVCVAYRNRETGETFTHFPSQIHALSQVEPVYETMPGWQSSVKDIRQYEALPAEAKQYLARLETLLGCRISIISVGPDREQTILLENPVKGPKRRLEGGLADPLKSTLSGGVACT
jgi:adenylosuccinate synthase